MGRPGPFDLVLANASLQWVPDHAALLPRLVDKLAPGGSLAVQVPDNLDEPAHRLMREVAAAGPWAEKLAGAATARESRRSALWYFEQLLALGTTATIWGTTYYHPLAGGAAAYFVVTRLMQLDFVFLWGPALVAAGAALTLTIGLGLVGTWRVLGQKPAAHLRSL